MQLREKSKRGYCKVNRKKHDVPAWKSSNIGQNNLKSNFLECWIFVQELIKEKYV